MSTQAWLNYFNLKGGPIMGLWSIAMIGLSIYSTVKGKPIDGSVATMYGTSVLAYAGTKGVETYTQSQAKVTKKMEAGDV